jgi:hypothetical protein
MEAPYVIAQLPKPFDKEYGGVQAAPVYAVGAGKKRKRHEVAVGIDGESVNIYNVQSQTLTTSYALPPQTYLCCPPCSCYVRKTKSAGPQRRTYLVLRDGPQDTKRRLLCLTEATSSSKISNSVSAGPQKQTCQLADGEVVGIDVISNATAKPQVLVSYISGAMVCMSADLTMDIWRKNGNGAGEARSRVEHTGLTDFGTARKGLLAGRQDVIAVIQSTLSGLPEEQELLYQIVRNGDTRTLEIYRIRPSSMDAVPGQQPGLSHLVSFVFPMKGSSQFDPSLSLEVHAGSGMLYQLQNGSLSIMDFSGTVPRLVSKIGTNNDTSWVSGFIHLSSSKVVVVHRHSITIRESRHGTVLSSAAIDARRENTLGNRSLRFFYYWRDLGLAIGLLHESLIAIQFGAESRSGPLRKESITHLSDVVGKYPAQPLPYDVDRLSPAAWLDFTSKVDNAIKNSDFGAIEAAAAMALQPGDKRDQFIGLVGSLLEGDPRRDPAQMLESLPLNVAQIYPSCSVYLLSKLFAVRQLSTLPSSGSRLTTTIPSPLVYQTLALCGLLTLPRIQQAVWVADPAAPTLQSGDIMTALKGFDETFELMNQVLGYPVHWDLPEVVQGLRLLIQSLDTPLDGTKVLALPMPTRSNGEDISMVNGDAETHVASESALAERELDAVMAAIDNGVEFRSAAIRTILDRMSAFPEKEVTKCMRSMMRHEEILFFIKLLRVELLNGGWHRSYVATEDDDGDDDGLLRDRPATEPRPNAIGQIGHLMNCAIDAIGMSGWLVGQSSDFYGTHDLISDLQAEIGASLEGLYEYDSLRIFLDELQAYDYSFERHGKGHLRKRKRNVVDNEVVDDVHVLPVGARFEPLSLPGLNKKVRTEKSVRLEAAENRARIGKYVFERIRI